MYITICIDVAHKLNFMTEHALPLFQYLQINGNLKLGTNYLYLQTGGSNMAFSNNFKAQR